MWIQCGGCTCTDLDTSVIVHLDISTTSDSGHIVGTINFCEVNGVVLSIVSIYNAVFKKSILFRTVHMRPLWDRLVVEIMISRSQASSKNC